MKTYLIALITFLIIDGLWLSLIANNFYQSKLDFLLSDNVNYLAAILFYLIFIYALKVLVIDRVSNIKEGVKLSIIFGLASYAAYDLTNLAVIEGWPLIVTVVDIIWGTVISIIVTVISYRFK